MWVTHTRSRRRWKTSTWREFQWELYRHGLHTSRLVCNLPSPPWSPVQCWQHAIRTLIGSQICVLLVWIKKPKQNRKENMPHCVIQKKFVLIIFPKCKADLSSRNVYWRLSFKLMLSFFFFKILIITKTRVQSNYCEILQKYFWMCCSFCKRKKQKRMLVLYWYWPCYLFRYFFLDSNTAVLRKITKQY